MGLVPAGTRSRGHYTLNSLTNPPEDLTHAGAKLACCDEAGIVISEMF